MMWHWMEERLVWAIVRLWRRLLDIERRHRTVQHREINRNGYRSTSLSLVTVGHAHTRVEMVVRPVKTWLTDMHLSGRERTSKVDVGL